VIDVPYEIVEGDLLECDDRYIVHQCNCVTTSSAGIARAIFDRFPWADVYSERRGMTLPLSGHEPGEIIVRGNGDDQRFVINLFGQRNGGRMGERGGGDDEIARRWMFMRGLKRILQISEDLVSIGFPWKIGCGIAGGDWEGFYERALQAFAIAAERERGAIVRVHRLPDSA